MYVEKLQFRSYATYFWGTRWTASAAAAAAATAAPAAASAPAPTGAGAGAGCGGSRGGGGERGPARRSGAFGGLLERAGQREARRGGRGVLLGLQRRHRQRAPRRAALKAAVGALPGGLLQRAALDVEDAAGVERLQARKHGTKQSEKLGIQHGLEVK